MSVERSAVQRASGATEPDAGASLSAPVGAEVFEFSLALLMLTVRENRQAMDTIAGTIAEAAGLFAEIEQCCSRSTNGQVQREIELCCGRANTLLRDCLIAVQSHDITDQRLTHLSTLLADVASGELPDIASVLTESEERALLKLMRDGVSLPVALGMVENMRPPAQSIELF